MTIAFVTPFFNLFIRVQFLMLKIMLVCEILHTMRTYAKDKKDHMFILSVQQYFLLYRLVQA